MANIIQVTTFSGQDGAKQLAELNVRRCDSVIYCKTNAEANCYCAIIAHYAGGRKGVDHLYGTIAICVDPSSTEIEGLHLISRSIPTYVKSTYPFQFQAKKVGEDALERFLTSCGLTTEKELKAVWERCAKRLAFPIVATSDEKSDYLDMFEYDVWSIIINNHDYNFPYIPNTKKMTDGLTYDNYLYKFLTIFACSDA